MTSMLEDLLCFLSRAPTSWHCVKEAGIRLASKDFEPLEESSFWSLEEEKKYFVSRGGSFAAFCLPKNPPSRIVLMAAHTDSPSLKVKPSPDVVEKGMHFLEVETYGGPILHSWLNRDLALAGKVFFIDKRGAMQEKLLFLDDLPMIIPELAIHLQRDVNEKGPLVNVQEHLLPLICADHQESVSLEALIRAHVDFETLLSFDLFLVPIDAPKLLGKRGDVLASYRIDNLVSVHAALCAIASYQPSQVLPICLFFDHEEVGSRSWEGAMSSFAEDLLLRLKSFYSMTDESFCVLKNNSLCLSLDMAHGLHPMHAAKHDPKHAPLLGKGIVLKSNAGLKYASSAETLAQVITVLKKANLPFQHFVTRSDMPCGSTVGPFLTSSLGIRAVDLGCPQLSMHSIREVTAVADYFDLVTFLSQSIL